MKDIKSQLVGFFPSKEDLKDRFARVCIVLVYKAHIL